MKAKKKQTIAALCTLALGLSACSVFTTGEAVSEPDLSVAKATRSAADTKQREARGLPPQPADAHGHAHGAKQVAAVPEVKETVTASHILIAYQGARAAAPTTTRSKEQAQKLAEEIAQKVKRPGVNFGELAIQYTDDPSGKSNGGKLGSFERGRMVKPFADAAFALSPGETSGVVETGFGFHVIYREK
ncbi:MAG TPA: peptidylprolyl isomerase [Polyangiales bacterium]